MTNIDQHRPKVCRTGHCLAGDVRNKQRRIRSKRQQQRHECSLTLLIPHPTIIRSYSQTVDRPLSSFGLVRSLVVDVYEWL